MCRSPRTPKNSVAGMGRLQHPWAPSLVGPSQFGARILGYAGIHGICLCSRPPGSRGGVLGITWLWFGNPWQGRACRALGIDRSRMGPAPEHSKGRENPEPRHSLGQDGAGMGSVGLTLPLRCSDSHKTRGGRGGGAAGMLPPALGFIQRGSGISRASFHPGSASFPVIPEAPGSSREGGGFPGRG